MAWSTIDEQKPLGTQKVKDIDDAERETRAFTENSLRAISNYSDSGTQPALRVTKWTTAGRPTGANLVDRVSGLNTDLGYEEYYDLATTTWISMGNVILPAHTVATRPAGKPTGYTAYCTDLNIIERYNGSTWTRVSGGRRGDIKMWAGAVNDIETGWVLADGVQRTHPEGGTYTPANLRDKFIVGAGTTYTVAATGGAATHTLTTNEMPSHSHNAKSVSNASYPIGVNTYMMLGQENGSAAQTVTTATAGGGAAHNNLPPYYALCYLYKI